VADVRTRDVRRSAVVTAIAAASLGLVIASVLGWRLFERDEDRFNFTTVPFRSDPYEGDTWEQDVPESLLDLRLKVSDVPPTIRAGEDLHFVVELHNPTRDSIALQPCPAIFSSYGESGTVAFEVSRLNCKAGPREVKPKQSVRFAWRIQVPRPPDEAFEVGFAGTVFVALRGRPGTTDATSAEVVVVP